MSSANKRTRKRNAVILLDSDSEVEAAPAKRQVSKKIIINRYLLYTACRNLRMQETLCHTLFNEAY